MARSYHLHRFVEAQERIYPQVLAELRGGRKQSHWMWFIFPQLAGLGRSVLARQYAIASREEAEAYLNHPLLGPRLEECTAAVLAHPDLPAEAILGVVDAMKLRSSLSLFADVAGADSIYAACLRTFFGGQPDPLTLALLQTAGER